MLFSHGQIQLLGDVELLHENGHLVVPVLLRGRAPRREVQTNLETTVNNNITDMTSFMKSYDMFH